MSLSIIELREKRPDKYPARMGEKWTEEEEIKLIDMIQEGKTVKIVAETLQRTVTGVKYRLEELALKLLEKGYTMDQVQDMTKLKLSEINEANVRKAERGDNTFGGHGSQVYSSKQRVNDKNVLAMLRTMRKQIDQLIEQLEDPLN